MPKRGASKPPADAKEGKEAKTSAAPTPPPSINVNHLAEVGAAWERIMALLVQFKKMVRLEVKTSVPLTNLIA